MKRTTIALSSKKLFKVLALSGVLTAVMALGILVLSEKPAYAAALTVTKTADTSDGTCDGDCSLREAILAFNFAAGADTITVPAGTYTLSRVGADGWGNVGDLNIEDSVTITGAGARNTIIDGGGISRVLTVRGGSPTLPTPTVLISNVTITGGNAGATPNEGSAGGGINS